MHPSELIKTPFGRVSLVKPYEYSELSEPIDRLIDTHPSSTLTLEFQVDVVERLKGFEVDQYLPGILSLCEAQLNKFGKKFNPHQIMPKQILCNKESMHG